MKRNLRRLTTLVLAICATVGGSALAGKDAQMKPDAKETTKSAPAGGATATSPSKGIAAVVGDRVITLEQLDAEAASQLMKVRQEEFEVRREALDALINEQLFEREAKALGTTVDALLNKEIVEKVADPTEQEIDAFYNENKAQIGETPKEEIASRIAEYLKGQRAQEAQTTYIKGLRQKYGVKVKLEPYRLAIDADDDAVRGPAGAPVTIIAFSDYQCPFCSRAEHTVQEVLKKYDGKVRLIYRDFPLSFHQNAQGAAEAAQCAGAQNRFWEMHDVLFAQQDKLDPESLQAAAEKIGLNKKKFKACMDEGSFRDEVQKDMEAGQKVGVSGTPSFFINGIPLSGAQPMDAFSAIIDAELERLN